jgi:hypothetical protein
VLEATLYCSSQLRTSCHFSAEQVTTDDMYYSEMRGQEPGLSALPCPRGSEDHETEAFVGLGTSVADASLTGHAGIDRVVT